MQPEIVFFKDLGWSQVQPMQLNPSGSHTDVPVSAFIHPFRHEPDTLGILAQNSDGPIRFNEPFGYWLVPQNDCLEVHDYSNTHLLERFPYSAILGVVCGYRPYFEGNVGGQPKQEEFTTCLNNQTAVEQILMRPLLAAAGATWERTSPCIGMLIAGHQKLYIQYFRLPDSKTYPYLYTFTSVLKELISLYKNAQGAAPAPEATPSDLASSSWVIRPEDIEGLTQWDTNHPDRLMRYQATAKRLMKPAGFSGSFSDAAAVPIPQGIDLETVYAEQQKLKELQQLTAYFYNQLGGDEAPITVPRGPRPPAGL